MSQVLIGVVTVYATVFIGQPLFCDTGQGLVFSEDTEPWVALDVDLYGDWAHCGDKILIRGDGWELEALALDAGPLHEYWIEDWPDLPIIADVPMHLAPFPGLSAQVTMTNLDRQPRYPIYGERRLVR